VPRCGPCLFWFILDRVYPGNAVYLLVSGHPLPPDLLESWDWGHTTTKIFELEGLTCKIFRTKELAVCGIIFWLIQQLHD
jgi:hypothetical protein